MFLMDEWTKYIQENNVAVEVLIIKKLHGKLFYTVLELYLDQWNARHVTLFGVPIHAIYTYTVPCVYVCVCVCVCACLSVCW